MKKLLTLALILFAAPCFGEGATISKADLINLQASSYVHGFKEFDTSVVAFEDSVSVGIYYDYDTQSKDRAEQLAEKFSKQLINN